MVSNGFARGLGAGFAFIVLACGGADASAQARLTAGAGKASIDIPAGVLPNAEGFGVERDRLGARVLVLDNGSRRVALAVVDLTSIFAGSLAQMKQDIARIDGVEPGNVWVVASHTFSAPHLSPAREVPNPSPEAQAEARKAAQYGAAVQGAVVQAATAAANTLRPARLGFGRGLSNVNVNRNMLTSEGWWLGADDAGPSDKSVAVLKIEGADRKPIAVLMNYAVQSSIMNGAIVGPEGKAVTADLGGAAVRHVENQYGDDAVSMFLVGAAGDQAPAYVAQRTVLDRDGKARMVDLGAGAYPLIDLLGERLGAEAVRVSQGVVADQDQVVLRTVSGSVSLDARERPKSLSQIRPSKAYAYELKGKADAPYFIMQIGDVALVGVQVELSAVTGLAIKQRSPFKKTIVMTMVNGAAKYMPDAESYRRFTYEAMNSSYGPGSAEILEGQILKSLNALHKDGSSSAKP